MKIKVVLISILFLLGYKSGKAQEIRQLTLEEVVQLALTKSDDAKITEAQLNTAQYQLNTIKTQQYPDFKISGQYQYLTNADVNLKLNTSSESSDEEESNAASPSINQLLLGQASFSMPVFSGFKLKNAIKAGENNYKAADFSAQSSKEQIALQAISNYLNLYKAQQTVDLVKESLKNVDQRVKDFTAMEENGILARNDLLKAQLQKANVQLTLEEAQKNQNILNYQLTSFLKLPKTTQIQFVDSSIEIALKELDPTQVSRADLDALRFREKAAENNVAVEKGNYFPSIALTAGYVALDIQNALTVTNAMNIGLGMSYNLSTIFKNKSNVKVAESQVDELQYSLAKANDQVAVQIENAEQEYQLALRNLEVYTQSEEQATENYRIVKDKYDNGLVDTNDLLEADIEQLQVKINLAYAQADIAQRYYELLSAQGKLTTNFSLK